MRLKQKKSAGLLVDGKQSSLHQTPIADFNAKITKLLNDAKNGQTRFAVDFGFDISSIQRERVRKSWEKLSEMKRIPKNLFVTSLPVQFLSTPSGEVLGFVADGKIYLDPSKINPETIAEEFIHLQQQALRLAAEQGNREARKIIRAWDEATKSLVNAFIGNRSSRATRDLLKAMGISENDMASEVYKKQPNESDQAYRTRLQDELWAKAQKKEFAEHLEKLANQNKLASAGMKIYKALKDFAIYLGKQLGIYNRKE